MSPHDFMGQTAYRKARHYRADAFSREHQSLIEAAFGTIESTQALDANFELRFIGCRFESWELIAMLI